MSYSISTLLSRNLHDVFGENDSERRAYWPDLKLNFPPASTRSSKNRAQSQLVWLSYPSKTGCLSCS